MPPPDLLLRTGVALAVLAGIAVGVLAAVGLRRWWVPAAALLRAAVQLAALSVVLTGVVADPAWVAVALLVMFAVAVTVAARRAEVRIADWWRVAASLAVGVGAAGAVVFASGAVDIAPRYVLAVGAMVIGNAMTVASLTGRTFARLTADRWAEVEAWLALGATPRRATRDVGRAAIQDALLPGIDQTRTTGLVVLPGAFVGAIFGGLPPVEAGRFQVVVLAAIIAAGALTSALTVRLSAATARRPRTAG